MDWNWFFSSFAQSSAAIVGIYGAFLITKILNNQALFIQKNNKAQDILVDCRRVMDLSKNRYFDWYNKHTNSREYEKLIKMLKGGENLSAIEFYSKLNFSTFSPKNEIVENINIKINGYKEEKRKKEEELRQLAAMNSQRNSMYASMKPVHTELISPMNIDLIKELRRERELIESTLGDVRHHIRMAQNMMDDISDNPESSTLITKMLIFVGLLFFFGVVYPLSFLPVNTGEEIKLYFNFDTIIFHIISIKGAFLLLLSFLFSSILITFFLLNIKLKYSNKLISELLECQKLSSYSIYFAIMEENEEGA